MAVLRTHDQTHGYNWPYQTRARTFDSIGAEVDELSAVVREGDVVIAASDGVRGLPPLGPTSSDLAEARARGHLLHLFPPSPLTTSSSRAPSSTHPSIHLPPPATPQVLDNLFDDALQFLVAERLDDLTSSDPLAAQGAVDALARCIAESAGAIGKMGDASGLKTPFSQAAAEEARALTLADCARARAHAIPHRRGTGAAQAHRCSPVCAGALPRRRQAR